LELAGHAGLHTLAALADRAAAGPAGRHRLVDRAVAVVVDRVAALGHRADAAAAREGAADAGQGAGRARADRAAARAAAARVALVDVAVAVVVEPVAEVER